MFKKGNKYAKGGARSGAGRPRNEFRELCKKAFDEVEALALVKSIIVGKKYPSALGDMPAKPETRLEAVKTLKEWGHGKEKTEVEYSGEVGSRIFFVHPPESE